MKALGIKRWGIAIIISLIFSALSLGYTMDADLWNLPMPKDSKLVWKDQPLELNGVSAPSVRFSSSLPASDIKNFYKDILIALKWVVDETNPDPAITTFSKNGQYIYILILPTSQDAKAKDVFIVKGNANLAVCYTLKDQLFQKELANDMPGKDMPDVLRYPGSKRRIDFSLPGQGTFLVYEAEAKPQEIAKFYRQNLKISGWQENSYFSQEAVNKLPKETKEKIAFLCMFKNKELLLVTISNAMQLSHTDKELANRSMILIARGSEQFLGGGGGKN